MNSIIKIILSAFLLGPCLLFAHNVAGAGTDAYSNQNNTANTQEQGVKKDKHKFSGLQSAKAGTREMSSINSTMRAAKQQGKQFANFIPGKK